MSKKKERAFFVCPRWNELAIPSQVTAGPAASGLAPGLAKIISAIDSGQPVARSTLRKALFAVRGASGVMFDVDAYIVDRRTTKAH